MVIENDPSARMQVRSKGELVHPGRCMVCGNGNCDSGYLDLGVFFDYEGTMYLCMSCCTQAGETIGMFTPDEVKSQQELIEKLTHENVQQKEELDYARPIIGSLRSSIPYLLGSAGPASDVTDFVVQRSEDGATVSVVEVEGSGETNSEESPSGNDSDGDVTESTDAGEPEPAESVKGTKRSRPSKSAVRDFTF